MHTIHFGRWFGALYRKTQTYMKESFKELGLGFSDSIVLVTACIHEGISQDEISSKLAIDKAVTAKSIKNLEGKGLIKRETHSGNLRMKKVFPTPDGLAMKERIDHFVAMWNRAIVQDLNEEELKYIFPALRKMALTATSINIESFLYERRSITSDAPYPHSENV